MAEVGLTQAARLFAYLRAHPGASILEITFGLDPFVANPRARISDLRKNLPEAGFELIKEVRPDGYIGYAVVPLPPDERLALGIAS